MLGEGRLGETLVESLLDALLDALLEALLEALLVAHIRAMIQFRQMSFFSQLTAFLHLGKRLLLVNKTAKGTLSPR